ncbi:thiopeptide-type bacteriocin biosynthesis protein [Dermacoccaceae bacterium W4C1]
MSDENRWYAWHLHLDTPEVSASDRVLTEVISPLVRELELPWFFIRYWQGGPHLRLRIANVPANAHDSITQRLHTGVLLHGGPRDGERSIDPKDYADSAHRHARGETGENRSVTSLRTCGAHVHSYEAEVERYGGASVMAASEDLFQHSSALVRAIVAATRPAQRPAVALRLTEVAAATVGSDHDQGIFHEIGLRSWTAWAQSYGFSESDIAVVRAAGQNRARTTFEPTTWSTQWATHVADLRDTLRLNGHPVPGAVISSHVHMTHNRLGLSILDELRTYATLAAWNPVAAESVPDVVGAR